MLAISWVAAFVACLGYGVASVLQSVGAKRTAHVGGVSGVALILLQAPYLLGLAVDGVAFVANIVALRELPLFLVQSIMTASVGVTALVAALRGTRLAVKDWVALVVLGGGLVILTLTAATQSAVRVSEMSQWLIFASAVIPAAIGTVGIGLSDKLSSIVLAFAAGLAFTAVAVASRGLGATRLSWSMIGSPLLWTIALQGVLGMVFFALALQRGQVTTVTAITFVVEMIIPSVMGVLLFDDSVDGGLALPALIGFALAIAGTIILAKFGDPEEELIQDSSDEARSPSDVPLSR